MCDLLWSHSIKKYDKTDLSEPMFKPDTDERYLYISLARLLASFSGGTVS